jgi:hypothetical protein
VITGRAADRDKFKTPSLRDVARRAPYFHDGSVETLPRSRPLLRSRRCAPPRFSDDRIHPLGLKSTEIDDLVAFLECLSVDQRAGIGPLGSDRAQLLSVHVVDLRGQPIGRTTLRVRPFGDRLGNSACMPKPFDVETDADGGASFAWPPIDATSSSSPTPGNWVCPDPFPTGPSEQT